MTKTFWCVFGFTVLTAVHLQNANAKFHKVEYRHYSGEAESVYISSLCDKFTEENIYQILSQSVRFCRVYMYIKNHFGVFFRFTV